MEEIVHGITTKTRHGKKSMTTTDRDEVESSFNLKISRNNIMCTFFYSNISEFTVNLDIILDEGVYKISIQNTHNIGWMAKYFKYFDVSILCHGCSVSQVPQFYEKMKHKYQILPRPHVKIYSGENNPNFLQETWIIGSAKSIEIFLFV